jgi:hypothetical protein
MTFQKVSCSPTTHFPCISYRTSVHTPVGIRTAAPEKDPAKMFAPLVAKQRWDPGFICFGMANYKFAAFMPQLNMLLQHDGDAYILKVSVHNAGHNHHLGPKPFKRLHQNRLNLATKEVATVDMLRKVGLSRRKILRFIWDNTNSEPNMVNVHNLMVKLKHQEDAGMTLSDRVAETLDRFCEKDRCAVGHVEMDRQGDKVPCICPVIGFVIG